jgi:hypothetical protein
MDRSHGVYAPHLALPRRQMENCNPVLGWHGNCYILTACLGNMIASGSTTRRRAVGKTLSTIRIPFK